jgi:YD repeat-containing protein
MTTPDQSVHRPTYNEANLLETVDVTLRGAQTATSFVADIDYEANGRRKLVAYGSGVTTGSGITTGYHYDPLTLRLAKLTTTREVDQTQLQDLAYTYDPVGNITRIEDAAQQTIFFSNQVVTPTAKYLRRRLPPDRCHRTGAHRPACAATDELGRRGARAVASPRRRAGDAAL